MRRENDQNADIITQTPFLATSCSIIGWGKRKQDYGAGYAGEGSEWGKTWAPRRASPAESGVEAQEYRKYNALGSRQDLVYNGLNKGARNQWGSGPPKARVLWGPIGTGGVNRRAVSPRSLFAYEPRVVFRDNKRATSSSARNDDPTILRSPVLFPSLFLLFSSLS